MKLCFGLIDTNLQKVLYIKKLTGKCYFLFNITPVPLILTFSKSSTGGRGGRRGMPRNLQWRTGGHHRWGNPRGAFMG